MKYKHTFLLLASSVFFVFINSCQESEHRPSASRVAIKEKALPVHEKTVIEVLEPGPEEEDFPEPAPTTIPVIESFDSPPAAPSFDSQGPSPEPTPVVAAESVAPTAPPIAVIPVPVPVAVKEEAVCGNHRQEVLRLKDNPCPHELYGATTNPQTGTSHLYYFDVETGEGFLLGTITAISQVSAIEFDSRGELYAVGLNNSTGRSTLATLNCFNAEGEIVGETLIEDVPNNLTGASDFISDINFDPNGRLWAFLQNQKTLGTLNILTGIFTAEPGTTGLPSGYGGGIASLPFPNDTLYHADSDRVSVINQKTGLSTLRAVLSFPPDLTASTTINAMDADWIDNEMYVSMVDGDLHFIGVLDTETGVVTFLEDEPIFGPVGLDAIAFNQRYEKCERGPALPINTLCDAYCELKETKCDNGIDDDFDGVADCLDIDCDKLACNDNNACSVSEVCDVSQQACVATLSEDCDDSWDCTDDFCDPLTGDCSYLINDAKNVFGSCANVPTNDCLAGRCTESKNTIICTETPRINIPLNDPLDPDDLSCADDNTCTLDGCTNGTCTNTVANDGATCDFDENPCTVDQCEDGICVQTSVLDGPSAIVCETHRPGACNAGHLLCRNRTLTTVCIADNSDVDEICNNFIDDDCDGLVDCADADCPEGSLCDDGIVCTQTSMCWGGMCMGQAPPETLCTDGIDNDCDQAIDCVDSDCNGVACLDDGNACTVNEVCSAGRCFGTPLPFDYESKSNLACGMGGCCSNGLDDDCDTLVDCADTSCQTGIESNCRDEVDNNCNGLIDCNDVFCKTTLAQVPEDCFNTIDDNCNGRIDCADLSCRSPAEICHDMIDNNCNALIDCQEPSCQFGTETFCHDGIDNNCNNLTDCQEPTCQTGAEVCLNSIDDDCNGLTDCQEAVCINRAENCTNGIDDNCNNLIDINDPVCQSRRVFVSIATFSPNPQTGILGADTICQAEANSANLLGTFKAWISDSTHSPNINFVKATVPYRLVDGTLVANSYAALVSTGIAHSIDRHADNTLQGFSLVYTGTNAMGNSTGFHCNNWTDPNVALTGTAGTINLVPNSLWTNTSPIQCNSAQRVYCFEQ